MDSEGSYTIAIIPARSGCQRIPKKNIRDFCGKPMIAWSIEAALSSKCFDDVFVSTDDEDIAQIARTFGATVPFLRPHHLADHHTGTRPVINHAIECITALGHRPELVCCIYATAPFLTPEVLRSALDQLRARDDLEFVFSCGAYRHPIQRALRRLPGGGGERLWPAHRMTRSQDLEMTYHDAGQFYWGRTEAFLAGHDVVSPRAIPYVLPEHSVHDIDTEEDWCHAELLMRALSTNLR